MHAPDALPPVQAGIFSDEQPPRLLGGYCAPCDFYQFPRQDHCPRCLQAQQERMLGGTGVVYSVTTVRVRPPLGLPQPYAVAYVDLDEVPLRVFGLIDPDQCESICIGDQVALKVLPLGLNQQQQACLRPCFHRPTNQE